MQTQTHRNMTAKASSKKAEPKKVELKKDDPAPPAKAAPAKKAEAVKAPEPPKAVQRPEMELAKKHGNKDYVVNIAVPATMVPLVRDAWNAVREGDAPFDSCVVDFKMTLLQHAIDVIKTHKVLKGDTHLARFERQVASIEGVKTSS